MDLHLGVGAIGTYRNAGTPPSAQLYAMSADGRVAVAAQSYRPQARWVEPATGQRWPPGSEAFSTEDAAREWIIVSGSKPAATSSTPGT